MAGWIRKMLALSVFFVSVASVGPFQTPPRVLGTALLGNVLYCLRSSPPFAADVPPLFEPHLYRVRYMYGRWPSLIDNDGIDVDHELRIMVYGPREMSATLYEVYLETEKERRQIACGDGATFKAEHGRLVTEEIPGGLATLRRIERLRDAIVRQPPVSVRDRYVRPGAAACDCPQ